MKYVLGISAYYHDSAAVLLKDGEIQGAVQEERFTRIKHDCSFPQNAIGYLLEEAEIDFSSIDCVVFYDKPFFKFERLLESYLAFAPRGILSFIKAMPVWVKEKLFTKYLIRKELKGYKGKILFTEHHLAHAASAFYPSPFSSAAILTIDGVGEWATATIGVGSENQISLLRELNFPHSVGLLYSAFTYFAGFRVNSGEYKLMGLAPYGDTDSEQTKGFVEIIKKHLVDIREDGSILLNMKYFDFATGLRMTRGWNKLLGIKRRKESDPIELCHMNFALAAQIVTEEIVFKLAQTAKEITGEKHLVLAGGVALNSVANGKIAASNLFDDIWIQPAAGDAGGALGAALSACHIYANQERQVVKGDAMKGAYLGPFFGDQQIQEFVDQLSIPYTHFDSSEKLVSTSAKLLEKGNVMGWFQGRMEFGPRALGARSILADPRNPEMQKRLNLKIKKREGFRPFAPAVLEGECAKFFDFAKSSPYMQLVVPVQKEKRHSLPENYSQMSLWERLYTPRSAIASVTHIDFSARIQTVSKDTNQLFHQLIEEFEKRSGVPVVINTSFNVRGEPIVCTPEDAFSCFMNTEMDYLAMGNFLFDKKEMGTLLTQKRWKKEFKRD